MEAESTLRRPSGVVVLDAKAVKYLGAPVIHPDGNVEMILPHRGAEHLPGPIVQSDQISSPVELGLGNRERIESGFLLFLGRGHHCTAREIP